MYIHVNSFHQMKTKFIFKSLTMLQDVEDQYIKFIGDNIDLLNDYTGTNSKYMMLKRFLELYQKSTKLKVHGEIIKFFPGLLIIQTSKYVQNGEYKDYTLWIFTHNSPAKYDWSLQKIKAL